MLEDEKRVKSAMIFGYFAAILLLFLTLLCISWLVYGYFFKREIIPNQSERPTIEVLLPCHNEEAYLSELFLTLEQLEWGGSAIRFCAIDDRSTDRTNQLLQAFVDRDSIHRRLIAIDPSEAIVFASPKKNALQRAIQSTNAEWVITLDADSRPRPDWLEAMFTGWEKNWIAIVPSFTFSGGSGLGAQVRKLEAQVQSFLMRSAIRNRHPLSAIGAGFAYKVAAFHEVGGYGGSIGERVSGDDDLLLHRFATLPGKIVSQYRHATMEVLERESGTYWRARGRHYSVAPDYPLFWKLFGAVTIPGAFLAPFLLLLDALYLRCWYGFGVACGLFAMEAIVLQFVAVTTRSKAHWWYPFFLFFGFPGWLLGIGVATIRRKPGW